MNNEASMNRKYLQLYWFSASGNTLRSAEMFAECLRKKGWAVELKPIERQSAVSEFDPHAVFGLAFPTYSFSAPKIVRTFVESIPSAPGSSAVMLGTQGVFSGGVLGPMRRILQRKGFRCVAGRMFGMPESYFHFTGQKADRRRFGKGLDKVARYDDDFDTMCKNGKTQWPRWPLVSDIHGWLFGSLFESRKLFRSLHTTIHVNANRCARCCKCVRLCPVGSLTMEPGKSIPVPDMKCLNCLRCVAVCPNDAMRHLALIQPYRSEPATDLEKRLRLTLQPGGATK